MNKDKVPAAVELIQEKIAIIRGERVMLDYDLAALYGLETKQLKRAVRRNIERFPEDFMFKLTEVEFDDLRSQFGTSSWGGTRYMPMAFTEQGVAMLSSVLNSRRAIEVNILIMRAFVKIRQMVASHKDLVRKINEMENKYDHQFQLVFEAIKALMKEEEKPKRRIGFQVEEPKAKYKVKSSF
ncbi:MAG: ORF6N domain-containing protein [Deltaproteobacteria bacterium]|nr:ORF6N domain-containing protein [Deltaproteobacteria bacterium]